MKKIYNAPYLKVVEVKNDIIATSIIENGGGTGSNNIIEAGTQGRHSMWDDDFDGEDLY